MTFECFLSVNCVKESDLEFFRIFDTTESAKVLDSANPVSSYILTFENWNV